MKPTAHDIRTTTAEILLDRKVEEWRQQPLLPAVAKAGAWMAGLLTSAAIVGFAAAGPVGAMVAPVILTLPAIMFAGAASGLSDDAEIIRNRHRDEAYAAAGLPVARGPSLLDSLAMWIGRRPAQVVEKRARADLKSGVWGRNPVDVRYKLEGEAVTPMPLPGFDVGSTTKIRLKADGGAMVTHTVDGSLQSVGGRPSAARIEAEGRLAAATWHDAGFASETWKAGHGDALTIEVQMLAGECYALADDIRLSGGPDTFADAIDELGRRAEELGGRGYATLPLTFDDAGRVSVAALDDYIVSAVNGSAAPRR